MVLGINFLTRVKPNAKRPGSSRNGNKNKVPYYSSAEEILMAVESKVLDWGALVRVKPVKFPIWDRVGHET
jgi:DNA-directed RNA polymerase subunit beta'